MDERVLEQAYRERLEERIISRLAEETQITYEKALGIYYHNRLAERIYQGEEGVQYLDYKVLAQILYKTEPGLFS